MLEASCSQLPEHTASLLRMESREDTPEGVTIKILKKEGKLFRQQRC